MVEETGEPGENHRPHPCHIPTPGFDPGSQRWQASALTAALSRPKSFIYSEYDGLCICSNQKPKNALAAFVFGNLFFVIM